MFPTVVFTDIFYECACFLSSLVVNWYVSVRSVFQHTKEGADNVQNCLTTIIIARILTELFAACNEQHTFLTYILLVRFEHIFVFEGCGKI